MQSLKNGTLLGAYTIIRMIARGGMGEVYEAHERQLQRRVALKVIAPTNPDEHDRDDLVRRFMQEARTLARVNHPNVVTIYAIESRGGTPYIAMEFVEGASFRHLLEELTFTVDGAIPLFLQMLEGLKSLHDNRIVHRDLKPHNILLRPDGQVKILDFGIAKHVGADEHTRVGVIVGTLPYMSPELKNGASASMRSDIWSLGAIFFECLTGKRLVECMHGDRIEFPQEMLARIAQEMRVILLKMCAAKPTERYLVAEQVIDDLKALQQTRPPVPPSVWSALAKRVETLAETQRRMQDLEVPPSEPPRNTVPQTPLPASGMTAFAGDGPPNESIHSERGQRDERGAEPPHPRAKNKTSISRQTVLLIGAAALAVVILIKVIKEPLPNEAPPSTPNATVASSTAGTAAGPQGSPQAPEPVALKEPADRQLLWLEPARLPTLSWSRSLNEQEYEIQISRDTQFKKLIVQEPVSGTYFRPERVLPEGTYYWRLLSRQPALPNAGPNSFIVSLLSPVELVAPDANHIFTNSPRAEGVQVEFNWNCKPGAKRYHVQIDLQPSFAKPVQERQIDGCDWTVANVPPGVYHWRVRIAEFAAARELWSKSRQFEVRAAQPASTPRPRPVEPALTPPKVTVSSQNFTLELTGKPRDIASLRRNVRRLPVLEWKPVKGARKYLVQFSASKDFSTVVAEEFVFGTRIKWRSLRPGQFFWRVAAVGSAGEPGNFSDHALLKVLLPAPQIKNVNKLLVQSSRADEQIPVDWPAVPVAGNYLVQYGSHRDLAGVEERQTKSPKLMVDPKPGRFYMRVAAADETGDAISAYSNLGIVEIEQEFALESPKTLSPPKGAHAPSKAGRISVVFSWSKVPSADFYTLEVATDSDFTQIIERRNSKNRGTLLQQAQLKGRIYWRVRASSTNGDAEGRSTASPVVSHWSEPAYFDVK